MGDRITSWRDCPNCGGKETVECYEALSSLMKSDGCEKCDYFLSYNVDDTEDVITITPIYPNLVKPPKHTRGEDE